jgi:hypothetical protein
MLDGRAVHNLPNNSAGMTCHPGHFLLRSVRSKADLHKEPFVLQAAIEHRDVLAITVVELRGHAFAGAENFLRRLTPSRMRHFGIHVRPESILVGT